MQITSTQPDQPSKLTTAEIPPPVDVARKDLEDSIQLNGMHEPMQESNTEKTTTTPPAHEDTTNNKEAAPVGCSSGKSLSAIWKYPATIEKSNFQNKSLSDFSFNTAIGCTHGCLFCYVPSTSVNKQARKLQDLGVEDADTQWGQYVFVREWDEKAFVASLEKADKMDPSELKADGNRAIMFCSTTDPYQIIKNADSKLGKEYTDHHRKMIRRALELIRDRSNLRVRILTRSPLATKDFELFKTFGDRLLFGMSLPTLNDKLARIYEPHAPAPSQRLKTLKAAKEAGINVFVAVAPTYPECDEADLRRTLEAVKGLDPVTVFHEPINIRAENVARIAEHGKKIGVDVNTTVFASKEVWRNYALESLALVERIAGELGLSDCLHLWPDKDLKSKDCFVAMQEHLFQKKTPGLTMTATEKERFKERSLKSFEELEGWLNHWYLRISEWPGVAISPNPNVCTVFNPELLAPSLPSELLPDEAEELAKCENVIRTGWDAFLSVGQALAKIRDQKLYRGKYATFERYAAEVHGMSRSHAYRLISAAEVVENLSPNGDKTCAQLREAHIRELMALNADDQIAAYRAALEKADGAPLTARLLKEAAKPYKMQGLPETASSGASTVSPQAEASSGDESAISDPSGTNCNEALLPMGESLFAATDKIIAFLQSPDAKKLEGKTKAHWKKMADLLIQAIDDLFDPEEEVAA